MMQLNQFLLIKSNESCQIMNLFLKILRYINGCRCPVCGSNIDISDKPALCAGCCLIWTRECGEVIKGLDKDNKNQFSDAVHDLIYLTYYRPHCNTPSKKMILDLKKHNTRDIYEFLADNLANKFKDRYNGIPRDTIIINVPRSRKAIIKYGFDQAELLAKSVSEKLNLNYIGLIGYKAGRRFIQQKELTSEERRLNALGSYYIKTKKITSIYGKRCILIDDIYTTGATLTACAKLLDDNGAKYVDCAVIAKTV